MVRSIEIAAADSTGTLAPSTYTITITDDETTITAIETAENSTTNKTATEDVLKKTLGDNVLDTKLKSKDWKDGNSDTTNDITATIVISDDYATTVTYSPDKLLKFIGKDKKTES